MKVPILAAAAAVMVLLAMSCTIARADQNGDDAVFCCTSINPDWDSGNPGFTPLMLGCTALDGSAASINSCARLGNYVLGCAESGFACAASQSGSGKKDCACGSFAAPAFN